MAEENEGEYNQRPLEESRAERGIRRLNMAGRLTKVIMFGGGTCGKWWHRRVDPSQMGLVLLWRMPQRYTSPCLSRDNTSERSTLRKPALVRHWLCGDLDLGFLSFRAVRNKILLVRSRQVYNGLLRQLKEKNMPWTPTLRTASLPQCQSRQGWSQENVQRVKDFECPS